MLQHPLGVEWRSEWSGVEWSGSAFADRLISPRRTSLPDALVLDLYGIADAQERASVVALGAPFQ